MWGCSHRGAGAAGVGRLVHTIVVAYDGERTEDEYFRSWKLFIPPARLSLVPVFVRSGGNPLAAVKAAARKKKKMTGYAEFWCVSDCDGATEECVAAAWSEAQGAGIKLCLSNRCFEVWLALHWKQLDGPIMSEQEAIALVREFVPGYSKANKSVPFAELLPRTDVALANAAWLRGRGHQNPWTNVDGVIKKIKSNLP